MEPENEWKPDCIGCVSYYAVGPHGFCSACIKNAPIESGVVYGQFKELEKQLNQERNVHGLCIRADRKVRDHLDARTGRQLKGYVMLRSLCKPRQPWSYDIVTRACKIVDFISAEEAMPILSFLEEQFSHDNHRKLALQYTVANRVLDRYNLRRLISTPPRRVNGVVDCYYGSDILTVTLPSPVAPHAAQLWNSGTPLFVIPKGAKDMYFVAIMLLWRVSIQRGLPIDMRRLIASYIFSTDWLIDQSSELMRIATGKRAL